MIVYILSAVPERMIFLDTQPPLWATLFILYILSFLIVMTRHAAVAAGDTRLKYMAEGGDKRAAALIKFLDGHSRIMAASVRFFSVFLLLGIGAVSAMFEPALTALLPIPEMLVLLIIVIIAALLYLILGVFLPKGIADRKPEILATRLLPLLKVITYVGMPFVSVPGIFSKAVLKIFGINLGEQNEDITEEEIRMMVDIGSESGAIDDDEKEMIHNIFEMDDKPVEEIMTHRTDAVILWLEDSADEWEKIINETNHTRYPVCGDGVDDVVGVLNSRDFYRTMLHDRNADLKSILREPYFVPDSLKADEMFQRMQDKNAHFAIVLDEYSGFCGIVTQEDLIEEIVGELYSEYDEPEKELEIYKIPSEKNTWLIDCGADIEDVEDELGIEIPDDDDYNTFAGLILDVLGTVPADGETPELKFGRMSIKVTRVEEHRIEEAVVTLEDEEPESKEDSETE